MTDQGPSRRRLGPPPGAPDGPRRLAESLAAALGGHGETVQRATVFSRWEEIAGPSLAAHSRPVRLEEGVLVVAVDQPAWATQLRLLSGGVLTRVSEVTGECPVRLEVTVRAP